MKKAEDALQKAGKVEVSQMQVPVPCRQWLSAAPWAFFGIVAAACGNKIPVAPVLLSKTPKNGAGEDWKNLPEDKPDDPLSVNKSAPVASPGAVITPGPNGAITDTAFTFLAMCDSKFDFSGYTTDPTLIAKSALYGNSSTTSQSTTHALVALQIPQAAEGDLLCLFRYESLTSGSLCSMRRVNAGDVNAPILFEGVYLAGTDKLEVILSKKSTCEKKRATLPCKPQNFVNSFDTPLKEVVSVVKLREGSNDEYSLKMPIFNLNRPATGNSFGFREGSASVPYFVPGASSTWAVPNVLGYGDFQASTPTAPAPALANVKYVNIFGEPVSFVSATFLLQENNLIVYVSRNAQTTYRYFISFG